MPLNVKEIRVAGTGRVLVADKGAPIPVDVASPWDATKWIDLGYTTADGVKFIRKDKLDPVDTWQTVAAIRLVYSDRDLSVKFALLQMNADTLPFFFGAPKSALVSGRLNIPASPQVDERALGLEFRDGAEVHRFVIPRGVVTETDETAMTRTGAIKLGVTFTALTPDTAQQEPLAVWLMPTTPPAVAADVEQAGPDEISGDR